MSFSQWTFDGSTDLTVGLDAVNNVVGASSLGAFSLSVNFNRGKFGYVSNASGLQRGITKGKVRSIFRVRNPAVINTSLNVSCGLYCMASTLSLLSSGSAYGFDIIASTAGSNVSVRKWTFGVLASHTATVLGSTTTATFANPGDTVAVELEWDADDQIGLGGTRVIARLGTSLIFNDLVTIVDVVDTSSPMTSSLAEGLYFHDDNGSRELDLLADSTAILAAAT